MATAKKPAAKSSTSAKKKSSSSTRKPAAKKTTSKAKPSGTAAKSSTTKKKAPTRSSVKGVKKGKSPFGIRFLEKQKAVLEEERAKYLHQAEAMREEADQLAAEREPGDVQFDEESGEGDTIAVERERDLALSAQAQESVRQIDEALERIADGTYGICVVSGDHIPKARLEAIPWAAVTVENKVGRLGR